MLNAPSDGFTSGKISQNTQSMKQKVFFKCDASINAPNYTEMFMQSGGKIDAMAARWESDFSLSGSKMSVPLRFQGKNTSPLSIEIPDDKYEFEEKQVITLSSHMRLNAMTLRTGAAINGTLATSLSAESSDFLYDILKEKSHYQMGMTYKTFVAHVSSLAFSNARIVSVNAEGTETPYKPKFEKLADGTLKMLEDAAELTEEYVKQGYGVRQAVLYEPSPMLHKTVFSEIVGINGRGYNLLHNIMDREGFMSLETLNSLYETAIASECLQEKADIQAFRSATDRPGLTAAMEARKVASATSLIVNMLMSYRADGRNIVTPTGASFAAVENWNNSVPRSCIETNDCDGLALLAVAMIRSTLKLTPEQLQNPNYEYLRSVRNVIFPHYQLALSVIGATAAEANSADHMHKTVAGHAITVLIPTMSFLRALSKTVPKKIGKDGSTQYPDDHHDSIIKARFDAMYPTEVVQHLPTNERYLLSKWDTAQHEFTQLQALAIEGTTPASSVLYIKNPELRAEVTREAEKDKRVFSMAAPNVFRSIKVLHVGGSVSRSTHVFYSDLVELTFAPDFPLYTDSFLRDKTAAASQYVLTTDINGENIVQAGCTPKELVEEEYGAFPLISLGARAAHILDGASALSKMDIVPPRASKPLQLDVYQSQSLAQSMEHIEDLERVLSTRIATNIVKENHHCVAYVCAFNTLVHNPKAVDQFVNTMKKIAVSGVVDKKIIPGLAHDVDHNEVGLFLHLDVYCALE